MIDEAFKKRIIAIENGTRTRVTVFGAIYKMLWTKEMGGDRRALTVRTKYEAFARKEQSEHRPRVILQGGLPDFPEWALSDD